MGTTDFTPAAAQKALAKNFAPWVQDLNLAVIETGPGHVLIRMPISEHLTRVGGIVSGQALAAMADTAMILAGSTVTGKFVPFATITLDSQFLRPGTGPAILARAEVVRAGKSMTFTRCEMTAEDSGKPVASATATLMPPPG